MSKIIDMVLVDGVYVPVEDVCERRDQKLGGRESDRKKELIQEVLKVFNEVRDQIWDPRNMERKRLQTPYSTSREEVRGQIIDVYI